MPTRSRKRTAAGPVNGKKSAPVNNGAGMDAVDFYNMVKHSLDEGRQPIDLAKLEALGELVWPGGGGIEILRLVAEVTADKMPYLLITS
jgi:hypothetical protein